MERKWTKYCVIGLLIVAIGVGNWFIWKDDLMGNTTTPSQTPSTEDSVEETPATEQQEAGETEEAVKVETPEVQAKTEQGWIVPYGAKFYKEANSDSEELGKLEALTAVTVQQTDSDWCKVKTADSEGYILKEKVALALEKSSCYVSVPQADFMDVPEGKAKPIAQLELGTKVELIAKLDEHWYLAEANGQQGCISAALIAQNQIGAQGTAAAMEMGRTNTNEALVLLKTGKFDEGIDKLLYGAHWYRQAAQAYLDRGYEDNTPEFLLDVKAQWIIDIYSVYLQMFIANEQLDIDNAELNSQLTLFGQEMLNLAAYIM